MNASKIEMNEDVFSAREEYKSSVLVMGVTAVINLTWAIAEFVIF
jgi:hypothetical protein